MSRCSKLGFLKRFNINGIVCVHSRRGRRRKETSTTVEMINMTAYDEHDGSVSIFNCELVNIKRI